MRSTSLSEHRFTRSMQKPKSGSRHLHAGHRLGSIQVAPRLLPSHQRYSVLMSSSGFRRVISGLLAFVFLTHT
jgi:hypothetical protein